MRKPSRRVSAADVAAAAGVSQTAVSFVLNGRDSGNIAADTKKRILEAADRLGYEPHFVAKSLRSRTTQSIGVVTDAVATSVFGGRLLAAAIERAHADGRILLLMDLLDRDELGPAAIRELERRQVDALIHVTMGFRVLDQLPESRIPLVLANCTARRADEWSVYPDDAYGATRALEHLVGLGHRRLAMLTGRWAPDAGLPDPGNISGPIRRDAFVAAARLHGAEVTVVETGWGINDGYHAAMQVLDVPPRERPTAIFAITDRAAVGAILAAARHGLSVPEDLSIIGFDDEEKMADCSVPPLTTIALPHAAMGDIAVTMAIAAAGGKTVDEPQRVLPCELLVRESTAPPKPARR
ncbi:LacI family DNA-binding transcriptional regulator [Tessaracoccus oleiagri]|uniref:LacI family DNA-binding transcriptional regulator n=1 Tax=Tessaracoccus oleiagri TaxID=686624 RepID=UPI001FDF8943|nr:LacI family DNA-binding transcriptional regulator [Tessaracoccus oleiagri]